MTVSTVKSENIINLEASPQVPLDRKSGYLKTLIDQDAIPITSVDEVGDIILLCPVRSDAVALDIWIMNDALDAVSDLVADIGLYYSGIGGNQQKNGNTSGVVVDADCFATLSTILQTASTAWASVRYEAANITTADQQLWQVGGLSADPGGLFYLGFTVTTPAATDAAGDIIARIDYI